MVCPLWVSDLEDYWRWCEQVLASTGGGMPGNGALDVQLIESDEGMLDALIVERQRLTYADGNYLVFQFTVNDDLELVEYNFHYARKDDTLVWRHDRHSGHEDEDGGPTHVHLPGDVRKPSDALDLGDVAELIREDQALN